MPVVADVFINLIQDFGYDTIYKESKDKDINLFIAKKKRLIKATAIEKWEHQDFKFALDIIMDDEFLSINHINLSEVYKLIVVPGNDVSESFQPIEVIAKRYQFCLDNNINIWGFDSIRDDFFLIIGSLPNFDFKLMKKLMDNKTFLGPGAQKAIEKRIQNYLFRGFHSMEEFEKFSEDLKKGMGK